MNTAEFQAAYARLEKVNKTQASDAMNRIRKWLLKQQFITETPPPLPPYGLVFNDKDSIPSKLNGREKDLCLWSP
jgi:hypothetical protein